jgi:osomolarity two-component system response regulator SKN7
MPKLDGVSATSLIRKFDHLTPIISMTSNSKPNEIMTYYSSGAPFHPFSLILTNVICSSLRHERHPCKTIYETRSTGHARGMTPPLRLATDQCKNQKKHLMHLKAIHEMSRIPRSVGIPPLSDSSFVQALTTQAALATAASSSGSNSSSVVPFTSGSPFGYADDDGEEEEEGCINPLAGMGLTDEQYNAILQNIVKGEGIMGGMGVSVEGMGGEMGGGGGGGREKRPLEDGLGEGREGKRTRFETVE